MRTSRDTSTTKQDLVQISQSILVFKERLIEGFGLGAGYSSMPILKCLPPLTVLNSKTTVQRDKCCIITQPSILSSQWGLISNIKSAISVH